MKFKIKYIDEITIVSEYILSKCLRESAHIFINGIIGAGKTTLASSIVNICSNVNLCSSSYSIVNVYEAVPLIIHCDFYRTEWSLDFYDMEIHPIVNGHHYLILEWVKPQILDNSIQAISIKIDVCSKGYRTIDVMTLN